MFVKCIKSRFPDLFVVDEIYDIETLISRTNDIQFIYDEDGDPWFFYNDLNGGGFVDGAGGNGVPVALFINANKE
ncbi:hypothetical protein ACULX1_001862 [Escherichia coli]